MVYTIHHAHGPSFLPKSCEIKRKKTFNSSYKSLLKIAREISIPSMLLLRACTRKIGVSKDAAAQEQEYFTLILPSTFAKNYDTARYFPEIRLAALDSSRIRCWDFPLRNLHKYFLTVAQITKEENG